MKWISLLFLTVSCLPGLYAQNTLTISGGAQLQSSGAAFIVLRGSSLVNNGALQMGDGGTMLLTGAKSSSFTGTGHTQLDHLWLQLGSADTLDLQTDLHVTGEVNFSGGHLNLNNAALLLGTTGSLNNESNTSHAFTKGTGTIQVTRVLNAPAGANPGNLGALLSSASNLGSTTIIRGHATQTDERGRQSIERYYIIAPTNNSSLDATLRFTYFPSEIGDVEPEKLSLWRNTGNINGIVTSDVTTGAKVTGNLGSSWANAGYSARGDGSDYIQQSGVQSFSSWTLFGGNTLAKDAAFKGVFALYPNPAVDQTTLNISSNAASKVSLRLIDGKGAVVRQKEAFLQSGANQLNIDLTGLARGVYTLNAVWGNNSKTVSFLKK
ncbi:MAG TPA: T9SS type A sorting domain-containing protein [Puia sp.]|nr:T9SS type A sorting domain-containing protein [Puia sp.]